MSIIIKIATVDRTEYIDARSLSITDELTSKVNSCSFSFICNNISLSPTVGQLVLIEEGTIKLFAGRILSKEEDYFPPNLLKYKINCIDYTRDLDKKLVVESYTNQLAGDIIKDILTKYTTGFTTIHIQNGLTLTKIAFDYVQVSEALTTIAESCGYEWYVDYDKDIWFFFKTDYPAPFQLDDNQEYYRDLIINYDVSQLRNRIYVKSSNYEILDFTELFIGDGSTVTWTCKYATNATPSPSLKLNDVSKTVGWDGVDDPDDYDFMLNATTKVLSLGTYQSTPADDDEIVITYGADEPIMVRWDDQVSIDAIKAIEGGDGIFEFCITDNSIDTKEWAIDVAKADLLQNADPVIQGTFTTNRKDIKSGQIITVNSTKRNITQAFLVQKVDLIRVDTVFEYTASTGIPYKPAAEAVIGYKPAAEAVIPYYTPAVSLTEVIYYVYEVTIATYLKGLEDLLLQLLYQSNISLKRDKEAPAVPTGLTLSTGMGSITQASLAWLKATWNANTEDDFSHYELKYKKTAYSDYGLVSTTNVSFIWTGLEQNIEYEVYIRAVDIYGNRSNWSSQKLQVTATDSDVPTQVAGATATALLAGIKVTWIRGAEDNIAGYAVERQESDDGTTWTGAWTEIVRTDTTMWLDLLLTYTKYYRYRIKAFTQTGTEGATSTPTADSIKPNKAGTNDIVANCITADLIAVNSIYSNAIQSGAVVSDKIGTGEVLIAKLGSDALARMFQNNNYKINIEAWAKSGAITYIDGEKIYAGSITLTGLGSTIIEGGYIKTNLLQVSYGDITGTKPPVNADYFGGVAGAMAYEANVELAKLGSTIISGGYLRTDLIKVKKVYVGGGTNEDIYFEDSGVRLYDAGASTLVFYKSSSIFFSLGLSSQISLISSGSLLISASVSPLTLVSGTQQLRFYNTSQLKIGVSSSAPTSNNVYGEIIFDNLGASGQLHIYTSGWRHITSLSGW
jgi:hypothetical protein